MTIFSFFFPLRDRSNFCDTLVLPRVHVFPIGSTAVDWLIAYTMSAGSTFFHLRQFSPVPSRDLERCRINRREISRRGLVEIPHQCKLFVSKTKYVLRIENPIYDRENVNRLDWYTHYIALHSKNLFKCIRVLRNTCRAEGVVNVRTPVYVSRHVREITKDGKSPPLTAYT